MRKDVAIVILAAGLGTRMKSDRAKVLHEILGQPMIIHVMQAAREIAGGRVVVVVGHQGDVVRQTVSEHFEAVFAFQAQQLGTGHAVICALPCLPPDIRDVVILYGDVPLLTASTVGRLLDRHRSAGQDLSILAVELKDPSGYGRLIVDRSGAVCRIVEEADADPQQKKIGLINTGIYCVRAPFLGHALSELSTDNAQGELYLTDIVRIGYRQGKMIGMAIHDDPEEVRGVNTRAELAAAESVMRRRLRFKS